MDTMARLDTQLFIDGLSKFFSFRSLFRGGEKRKKFRLFFD